MLDSSFLQIGSRPQFFIDDLVIESAQDMTRRHHKPQKVGDAPRHSTREKANARERAARRTRIVRSDRFDSGQ